MSIKEGFQSFLKKFQKWFGKENLYYRVFWGLIISISAWNIIWIFVLTLTRFFSDSISIDIDTAYLRWNNTFPGVSFCLSKNRSSSRILEFVKTANIPHKVTATNYAKNLHDLIFTNPNNINFIEDYCDGLNSTCGVDILKLRKELLPHSCEDIMTNISFRGVLYNNCSQIFKFHELELGYCFLANNILDYGSFSNLPLKYDISHSDKSLKVYLKGGFLWKYEMFVHSPEDFPYFNSITYDIFPDSAEYKFNIEEYKNNPDVKYESIEKRSCKFPEEREPGSPWHYRQSKNCSRFVNNVTKKLPKWFLIEPLSDPIPKASFQDESRYCDVRGLKCIDEAEISAQTKEFIMTNDACYPSCLEQQIILAGSSEVKVTEVPGALYLGIRLIDSPKVRYNRVVTQTYLDLVVSVGGIIGLFAGASALNIFEIIYIILRRN